MSDAIRRVLDGESPRDGLTAAEAVELAALEEAVARALASPAREPAPDVVPEVMRRIAALEEEAGAERRPGAAGAAAWLWAPRRVTVRLRPAYGLAAAAVLAGVLAWGGPADVPPASVVAEAGVAGAAEAAPAESPAARVYVHFRLDAPGARQVALAGDFTDWEPSVRLVEMAPGVWAAVVPLRPGMHDYAFLVDGESWQVDPVAPRVADGFGGLNSRLTVLAPENGRVS
jgi:hypothetical protein